MSPLASSSSSSTSASFLGQHCYILEGTRTPIGSYMGALSSVPAPTLAACTMTQLLQNHAKKNKSFNPSLIEHVILGQVIQAGVGQAPARQALMQAKLPQHIPAVTVNKVCGSGMEAIVQAARIIASGENNLVIAGGMENMSLAPHLLPHSRAGLKFGAAELKDAMQWDGLWDPYSQQPMGGCAEACLKEQPISRAEQDAYAIRSFERAQKAQRAGIFQTEITPVKVLQKKSEVDITDDEGPSKADFSKIPQLKPVFSKEGSITAANASTINDGAATLLLGSARYKEFASFKILGWGHFAQHPTWFTTAPIEAIKKSVAVANLSMKQIDLFEINEAFSTVALYAQKTLNLSDDRLNIYGGAIALGHPIGCSGARILVTLMNALTKQKLKYGVAALCIGGGEGISLVIENLAS